MATHNSRDAEHDSYLDGHRPSQWPQSLNRACRPPCAPSRNLRIWLPVEKGPFSRGASALQVHHPVPSLRDLFPCLCCHGTALVDLFLHILKDLAPGVLLKGSHVVVGTNWSEVAVWPIHRSSAPSTRARITIDYPILDSISVENLHRSHHLDIFRSFRPSQQQIEHPICSLRALLVARLAATYQRAHKALGGISRQFPR